LHLKNKQHSNGSSKPPRPNDINNSYQNLDQYREELLSQESKRSHESKGKVVHKKISFYEQIKEQNKDLELNVKINKPEKSQNNQATIKKLYRAISTQIKTSDNLKRNTKWSSNKSVKGAERPSLVEKKSGIVIPVQRRNSKRAGRKGS
jgi:hypothetical protein